MLFAATGLVGRSVSGRDAQRLGSVRDFLLDDRSWRVRWMVVDTGHWLPGRRVLIHPSAVAPIELPARAAWPMLTIGEQMAVMVNLTAPQVEAAPDASEDAPLTAELEQRLCDHYGWDPFWAASEEGGDAAVVRTSPLPHPAEASEGLAPRPDTPPGDPHLGSAVALKGFAVEAADGDAGSVENVLLDDAAWRLRHFIVATRRWLQVKLVQVPLRAVSDVDWRGRRVVLAVPRERLISSPAWDPLVMADEIAEERLRSRFATRGQGS